MKNVFISIALLFSFYLHAAQTYYVSPTGLSTNSGASFASPKDFKSAVLLASAGDSVILQSGTYKIPYTPGVGNTIALTKSGTASAYITVCSEPNTVSTIDFQFPDFAWVQDSYGFEVLGSYWKFKNLVITRAGYQGVYVKGGYNIFDYCVFYDNRNSGLEINQGGHHTTVINCDAYHNYDPKKGGSMADGYAVKQTMGAGNVLIGCRSWDNSDDAYDTFDSPEFVVLRNCWAFNCGIDIWNDPNIAFSGNGNGFKVGGNYALQRNILSHCVAFGNPKKGFDQNNNTGGITMYNCISYKNGINYGMGGALTAPEKHVFKNCISLSSIAANSYGTSTQVNNSWNSGFTVSSADFISLDLSLADDARNIDGSLPNNNLFRLKTTSALVDAGVDVGLAYSGTAPDLGAFETGTPTLTTPANLNQTVNVGVAISPIVFAWGGAANDASATLLPAGLITVKDAVAKTITISGVPTATGNLSVSTIGGSSTVIVSGTITVGTASSPTLTDPANKTQTVNSGTAISSIVFTWGGTATDVTLANLPAGLTSVKNAVAKTLTISGTPTATGTYTVTTVGGTGSVVRTGVITVTVLAATLTDPANKTQTVNLGTAIAPIVFTWGGGTTDVTLANLPAGLTSVKDAVAKTLTISGTPTATGTYTVTTVGGTGSVFRTGTITVTVLAPSLSDPFNKTQTVNSGTAISPIVFTWGGGATDVTLANLPAGMTSVKNAAAKTLTLSGTPTSGSTYTVTTVGGSGAAVVVSGTVQIKICAALQVVSITGLASTGVYRLDLYNAAGTTFISTLTTGTFQAGNSDYLTSGLSAGTYTYKLMNGATLVTSGTFIVP